MVPVNSNHKEQQSNLMNTDVENPSEDLLDETGANLIEYALLVSLIAVVCILAITYVGVQTSRTFNEIAEAVEP